MGKKSWHKYFEGMTVSDLTETIADIYDLDQFVAEQLCFCYETFH